MHTTTTKKADKRIVILPYGWVMIGNYSVNPETKETTLTDASVIRRWGTTRGLGEIAISGPTKDTILDPCGTVEIPAGSVVSSIRCQV